MRACSFSQKARITFMWQCVIAALFGAMPLEAHAYLLTNTFTFSVNRTIPDDDQTGFADTRIISSSLTNLHKLQVALNILGGYNGDLYAYLYFTNSIQQSSAFTVLLNRPGRTATDEFGYGDSGMNIVFGNDAPNGDIHTYRTVIDPQGGVLTGLWQPDARNVHPAFSLDSVARTADMSGFTGLNPSGSWTLFMADNSSFGVATLQSWQVNLIAVPEPKSVSLAAFSLLLLLAFYRTRVGKHLASRK